jgi:hypothetical protein
MDTQQQALQDQRFNVKDRQRERKVDILNKNE